MSQTPVTVKIDSDVKEQAQKLAKQLGLSLSAIIENKLREVVRERRVVFEEEFEPTPYLEKIIHQAEADLKAGLATPPMNKQEARDHLRSLMKK